MNQKSVSYTFKKMSSFPSIYHATQKEINEPSKIINKKKYCNIPDSVRKLFIKRVDSHEVTIKEVNIFI